MDKRDRIRGAMIGCAAGDALGYPVEALSEAAIVERYGLRGITDYDLDENGTAHFTADTQLMLLSANGILFAHTRGPCAGSWPPCTHIFPASTWTGIGSRQRNSHAEPGADGLTPTLPCPRNARCLPPS